MDTLCVDPADRGLVFDLLQELSELNSEAIRLGLFGKVDEVVERSDRCSQLADFVPFEFVDWQPMPKHLGQLPMPFEMQYKEDMTSREIFNLFRRQRNAMARFCPTDFAFS